MDSPNPNLSALGANFAFYADGTLAYYGDSWLEMGIRFWYNKWYYDDGVLVIEYNNTLGSINRSNDSLSDSTITLVDENGRTFLILERID